MNDDATRVFDKLMSRETIDITAVTSSFKRIGWLIDFSFDARREDGTTRALSWCNQLEKGKLTKSQRALLEYFRANAWYNREQFKPQGISARWEWSRPEIQQQIFHLRRAIILPGFKKLSATRRCQIYTNLANQLNTVGRFVEAQEYWSRAIDISPCFGKALGNKGTGLFGYAQSLYDTGHRKLFLFFADKYLTNALSKGAKYEVTDEASAKTFFVQKKREIESIFDVRLAKKVKLKGHSLGKSKEERRYREWVLQHRLFLNPLNDLNTESIAARDVLLLPTFVTKINDPPTVISLFNQLKQEFVSGRWILYDGLSSFQLHYSDKQVWILNALDYSSYGLAIEKVKAAYRVGYALFDKMAMFLNAYMNLGINTENINFRSVWFKGCYPKKGIIRPQFASIHNWPLRGLFWLGKDLSDPKFQDVMEPHAHALQKIRNNLEHGYLRIQELGQRSQLGPSPGGLTYSILRDDFQSNAVHVFKLARAGLIYLSLGMHQEEIMRRKNEGEAESKKQRMPMFGSLLEDKWKT